MSTYPNDVCKPQCIRGSEYCSDEVAVGREDGGLKPRVARGRIAGETEVQTEGKGAKRTYPISFGVSNQGRYIT
jgi:hypothetical protein